MLVKNVKQLELSPIIVGVKFVQAVVCHYLVRWNICIVHNQAIPVPDICSMEMLHTPIKRQGLKYLYIW